MTHATSLDWPAMLREMVGKPFAWNGRGPDTYDCWGVVQAVLMRLGRPFPADWWVPEGERLATPPRLMEAEMRSGRWQATAAPAPGDVVALSHHRRIHHVGVLVPGNHILHATPTLGVAQTTWAGLRAQGYRRIEVYRWA